MRVSKGARWTIPESAYLEGLHWSEFIVGIGFIIVIAFLAGLLGMFARQALANVESDNPKGTVYTHSAAERKSEEDVEVLSTSDWNAM